jgi:hypothetical protein
LDVASEEDFKVTGHYNLEDILPGLRRGVLLELGIE